MLREAQPRELFKLAQISDGQVRLATIVRLRWIAVVGQLLAILVVAFGLKFPVPLAHCLTLIALSAWLNVFLSIRLPGSHRLSPPVAAALLTYDILQLSALLYFTGGIGNPFVVLIVAPVTVSAATLPTRFTIFLGLIALLATYWLTYDYWPLPWYQNLKFELPVLYKFGIFTAMGAGMTFIALYVRRLAKEGREMSAALAATELVLASEQKLHALDGLAAAAAHELGTPLSTIVLVTKELEREFGPDHPHAEDIALLRSQAARCREILQTLTRKPSASDPMHETQSVRELVDEAASPYLEFGKQLRIIASPMEAVEDDAVAKQPVGARQPGVLYGVRNIIENAVDFAASRVDVTASWDADHVVLEISDDGPGFPPELLNALGDPYLTTKSQNAARRSSKTYGLGLGFFIAKTLLERSGATVECGNRTADKGTGAIVRITWPRSFFVAPATWAQSSS
ncbi:MULTISPECIES: ActS/PrrB/RegB family redox-sensitive histidine kinase [Filomicrobium]|uniref:histidine kinase n=1 Tax=Filomicrobium insigne TaxID=418854 RepID=A0A1H0ILI9_9HYPH|nr:MULTISPECIES: ActS/PrrB/RegB family redox-sensitive histidine kinase [Filomicrobium]SDO32215.1 two-component system, sensor histidine kinase RegB [Filomicrobium insigne]